MVALTGIGIGLSLVFGCVFVAFVAEIYYLLWRKNKVLINNSRGIEVDDYHTKQLFYLFCLRTNKSHENRATNTTIIGTEELDHHHHHQRDVEMQKKTSPFGEESIDAELMRLHNLSGPPRFLFTIDEETKEDLQEFDDGKSTINSIDRSKKGSSRTKSLSDFLNESPTSSPLLKPVSDSYQNLHQGFNNPLFESATEAELNRLRSSPPPKFKFLRDAEEKSMRKLFDEAEKKSFENHQESDFVTLVVCDRNNPKENHRVLYHNHNHNHNHNHYSQVLPLCSSPKSNYHELV